MKDKTWWKSWARLTGTWLLVAVLVLGLVVPVSAAEAQKDDKQVETAAYQAWAWQGKAPLTEEQTQAILAVAKGERPDPSAYLDKKYMRQHLKKFRDGVSFVMGLDSYVMYVVARKFVGREDNSCFVMPKYVCDDIARIAQGDLAVYEQALGFTPGYFQGHGGLVRLDVIEVADLHVRIPSGNEAGANSYWLPGGYTSGGVPEAVTDLIPKYRIQVTRIPAAPDCACR